MRVAALVLFSVCLFSVSGYSQNKTRSGGTEKGVPSVDRQRIQLIKADILKEIKNFPKKDQAAFYTRLGDVYWNGGDRDEGLLWIARGVDLGTSPAAGYENEAGKLTAYWNLLSEALEKDADLAAKLITKIREIEPDESNAELREAANQTYIVIARQILIRKRDADLALEFALRSLKGRKPAINWTAIEFFRPLKATNENLADIYFAKLVESVKNSGDKDIAAEFVNYFVFSELSNYPAKDPRYRISDAQKKELLEILIPFIQKNADDFISKKINACGIPSYWGSRFSEDYKNLLPEKFTLIEQANAACAVREKEPWQKTELYKKPDKTIEDFLELAKQVPDVRIRMGFLLDAALRAHNEKKWSLANEILNGIDKDSRGYFWTSSKIETASKLIAQHFNNKEQAEVARVLDDSPPELRPFIIVRSLFWLSSRPDRREEVLNLMNLARADFNKLDRYPANPWDRLTNPTYFAELLQYYVKFRYFDEAAATQEEAVKAFNRLVRNLPAEFNKNGVVPLLSSFSNFSNQFPRNDAEFINLYFDRIYENIGRIEQARARLSERLYFLRRMLEKPVQFQNYPKLQLSKNQP